MKTKYIVALDQGTSSSRAIIYDKEAKTIATSQKPLSQYYPHPAWVEQDPIEIWNTQKDVFIEAVKNSRIRTDEIAGLGITNQRETSIIWDRKTGEPIYNAIVWQDRRTSQICESLSTLKNVELIRKKTGLLIDAYFSATKISWILDNVKGARERAENGELAFGTVDSWIIWNLSGGKLHITDVTNASRTMLFNIHTLEWDWELMDLFNVPSAVLPIVKSSSEMYGCTTKTILNDEIPIAGIAGDQQAALFGQLCTEPGMAKTTYGTGCFLVMNTGAVAITSSNKLLTTIAWKIGDEIKYALEGSVFIGGAAVKWLRDGLEVINEAKETEKLAFSVPDTGGVYFVPALSGLGAPHWDAGARGSIFGITQGTQMAHIVRATLEAIALQVHDVINAMSQDVDFSILKMRVDGGATPNNFLMQFQSDILNSTIERPSDIETTALGAAFLAGLATGFWEDQNHLKKLWKVERVFEPEMTEKERNNTLNYWNNAIDRSKNWL